MILSEISSEGQDCLGEQLRLTALNPGALKGRQSVYT